jgi:hypothetical protein
LRIFLTTNNLANSPRFTTHPPRYFHPKNHTFAPQFRKTTPENHPQKKLA